MGETFALIIEARPVAAAQGTAMTAALVHNSLPPDQSQSAQYRLEDNPELNSAAMAAARSSLRFHYNRCYSLTTRVIQVQFMNRPVQVNSGM